jgi:DNA-binding beta-propeller fold protein YncE
VQTTTTGGATGVVADLDSGIVLKEITGIGNQPQAIAVDPASNEAIIVDAGDNKASIISLGPPLTQPQILEFSPNLTYTTTANVPFTITGTNFAPGVVARLDQTPICGGVNTCTVSSRQITGTIPVSMLSSARQYLLDVQNPDLSVSNVERLAVLQPISVGRGPVAVAIDTDRDLAVVTNMNDNTANLVELTTDNNGISPLSLGNVGVILPTISTGTTPLGVAVDSRLGTAVVANNGSNNATVIDETTSLGQTLALCASDCLNATGAAYDTDTDEAVITNTNSNDLFSTGSVSLIGTSRATTDGVTSVTATLGDSITVDQDPVAAAVDPKFGFIGVPTASSTSILDIVSIPLEAVVSRVNSVQNPSGIVFDPVNQIFVTVNSLLNNIVFTDPATADTTTAAVGIAPTSVDYNFQTSSLVTLNAGSHILSVLDYTCPTTAGPTCFNPTVRAVLGIGGAQSSALVLGPNGVAVDPKLNLAVVVDPDNSRVLLVPLPH